MTDSERAPHDPAPFNMKRFVLLFGRWFGAFMIGIVFSQIAGWLFDLSPRVESLIVVAVGVPIAILLTPKLEEKLGRREG